jgi:Rrf2 family protein
MKRTRTTGYALHALVRLVKARPRELVASHHIAHAEGVGEVFLLKVLLSLARARIVASLKGPSGGYWLARPPEKITLLEVVEALEGPIRGEVLSLSQGEAAALDKRLEAECEKVAKLVRGMLGKVSIKDLTGRAK